MRARSDVRSRAASLITVTLVIGLAGAVSMAAFAGAARGDTAYARYRAITNEPSSIVFGGPHCPFAHSTVIGPVARLPEVASMQPAWTSFGNVYDQQGNPLIYPTEQTFGIAVVSVDLAAADSVRPRLLWGRYPRTPDEALLGYGETDAPRPVAGQTIDVTLIKRGAYKAVLSGRQTPADLITVSLTVVGAAIMPGELDGTSGSLWGTPALADRLRDRAMGCDAGMVRLKRDQADVASFLAGVKRLIPGAFSFDTSTEATIALRSSSLQGIMLRLFGGLAALAALLVLGQVLVRRTLLAATDAPVLRALGMSRGQLVRAALLPAAAVAVVAAVLAEAGALALSVFTPLGQVRLFEAEPGVFVDPPVLVIGGIAIVVAVLACVAFPAWRTSRYGGSALGTAEYAGGDRRSKIAAALASSGLPVSAVAGTRLALEPGHGRSATPVRSAIVGLTIAVTAMVGAFGFAASMDRFTSNPVLWGIDFDLGAGHPFIGATFQDKAMPILVKDPGIGAATAGNFQEQINLAGPNDRLPVSVWGTQVMRGDRIDLTMLEGRWPETTDEIALGAQTARALGVSVGDTVLAEIAGATRELTVVGVPVFPDFGFGPGLGQGAGATMDLLREFYPDVTLNLVFARFADGADRQATVARINEGFHAISEDLTVEFADRAAATLGASLSHARKSRGLPLILAALFGVVALATLVHVLVTSIRRRRRDLAILRTIGFRRRQIAATIAWQATTIAVVALLIGVPLGFLVGRFTWALFADRLGVVSEPVEAWSSVAIVVPAVLLLANVVAIGPAVFARRTHPAQVLRAE